MEVYSHLVYQKVYKPIRLRPVMEVIALIMALFAALLAVERKSEDAPPSRYDREAAYYKARKAAREGILVRGRFKIVGKHGNYKVREKLSGGCATHGTVHTLRQAKEWLWCLHHDFDYEACKRAHKNRRARQARRDREYVYTKAERRRDVALQAAEVGYHNFSTDSEGNRTYYAGEWGTRSRGYGSGSYYDDDPYY
jgi:ABC-type nickel/cobalt efflux system permease component RcnA